MKKALVLLLVLALMLTGFYARAEALVGGIVQLSDSYTGHISQYTIYFTLGTQLDVLDTITLTFPGDTTFTQIGDIKNSVRIDGAITPTSALVGAPIITITVPSILTAATHFITIYSSAGIKNPTSIGGNKQIQIATNKEAAALSQAYSIISAFYDVGVTISPSPGTAGNSSQFTIYFTAPVLMNAGSYIYIDFPPETTLPSSTDANARKNYIVINGTSYPNYVSTSGTRLQVRLSAQISPNSNSTIVIDQNFGILHPLRTDYNCSLTFILKCEWVNNACLNHLKS